MNASAFDIAGRVVVLTGGSGRIGQSMAKGLSAAGARVAVLDLAKGAAPETDGLAYLTCDVTERADIEGALRSIKDRWGVPRGLINAAAIDAPPDAPAEEFGPFETFPEASLDRILSVNVKGVFLCCQVLGGAMAEAGRGAIVNIASVYGMVAPDQGLYEYRRRQGEMFFKPAAYATSKSALYNLTRYLAAYWGGAGVRVNTLSLGGVLAGQDAEFLEGYNAKVPLGRMASEDEYTGAVQFLLSDAASYMTGANLVIDGGLTAL
jgi:NAD(P)-dependent dehydrogenase (short-subunit alcohol dehydrogenase family)